LFLVGIAANQGWVAQTSIKSKVCYGGHLNPKWSPKYKNPPIWAKFDFQVDYDVAN
jgi:hypothetical protein